MSGLPQIQKLTEIKYQREQHLFKSIVAEETALRGELARLNEQEQAARQGDDETRPMRSIGADVIWLAWVGRAKTQLNLQLAQVLARKEHHLAAVRRAYGRVLVAGELCENEKKGRQTERAKRQMSTAQDSFFWK